MGRTIPDERHFARTRHAVFELARRRQILRETVDALARPGALDRAHHLAAGNLARWAAVAAPRDGPWVQVVAGDWGEVTGALTRARGRTFAVLNMANAHVPGGGYVEGHAAQEENMFRRSDCHFALADDEMDPQTERYTPARTELIDAAGGRVLLDTARPRVCVRGPEDRRREDLGYAWLADDAVFPFFELRAAAVDLRGGRRFDAREARRRVAAQLDTLVDAGQRHAVLSAFGCGAFRNPADAVARIYADELRARAGAFELVAFAIFDPGYGPDNFTPFAEALAELGAGSVE